MTTSVSANLMHAEDVRRSLSVRDLTDEAQGPHAMQTLLREPGSLGRGELRRAPLSSRRCLPQRALHPLPQRADYSAHPDLRDDPRPSKAARADARTVE
jgi:hypothetical protein